jgi:alkanesulfonate monooxygenase SsuD/methylene tetrahydromethanopterin reductase-like flavin-dependent oxidoreductase (luciferase family)
MPPGADWLPGTSQATFVADMRGVLDRISGVFDSVWMVDHLQVGTLDVWECWSTVSYFAALYPTLRFGTIVLSQSFRNPALLAKMAATLQCLTSGRVILGVGAGWNEEEYRAYGYDFPPNGVRVDQFAEALEVITTLWREPIATYTGRHYRIVNARCDPCYAVPPTLMVGRKKRRMLGLAARYADWWNADWVGPTEYEELVGRLAGACRDLGRDPASIATTWLGLCSCAPSADAAHEALKGGWAEGRASHGLVGTPTQIVDGLEPFVKAGLDQWMITLPRFPDLTMLDLLIDDVMPRLHARYGSTEPTDAYR